jgi:TolB-like protein
MPKDAERLWEITHTYVDPAHRAHFIDGLRKAEQLEAAAVPTKPSIAVLPFANMSGDPAQQYFSDGITEDIITELSRFRSLFVIARNSTFQYRDQAVDVRRVGRELGVQYVVEGSVRIAGERLRISAQLIEAGTGNHLWAERYDRDVGDVLAVQAETAQAIAAVAGARTEHSERARAMRLDSSNLRAYHHHLRGRHLLNRYRREAYQQAQIELESAIRLDPGLAEAYADLSRVHHNNRMLYWVADRAGALATAFALAQRGVSLDERSGPCRRALGLAHLARREHDDAGLHFETGLELNPNDTSVSGIYGFYLTAIGRIEEALRQFDIVAGRDPRDEVWIPWVRGIALFTGHRYEAAIRSLKQVADPCTEVRGWLAASLAMAGRTAEAKAALDDFLRLAESDMAVFPGPRLRDWEDYWHGAIEYRDQKDFDHLFAALKKAGWPE